MNNKINCTGAYATSGDIENFTSEELMLSRFVDEGGDSVTVRNEDHAFVIPAAVLKELLK